jgi:hypothetical protein
LQLVALLRFHYESRAPPPFLENGGTGFDSYSLAGPGVFFREFLAGHRVRALAEDPIASVAVLELAANSEGGSHALSLIVNGKSESSTVEDAETIRLLAHLPALWASARNSALVIGLGTGVTAGELSLYDDVGRIDVAEISPSATRLLPLFGAFTHDVHTDGRLRMLRGDALVTLRRAREPWDLIISEPSNPWVAGADQLFTREFYGSVRSRLAPNGQFVQWFQLYETDFEMLALVLNTLRAEFPTLHAFRGSENDLLLLAARRPFTSADRQRAEATLARLDAVRSSLDEIGVSSIEDILEREVQTLPNLLFQGRKYGVNTVDRPRLHYLAGRAMFDGTRITEDMLDGVVDLDLRWSERVQPGTHDDPGGTGRSVLHSPAH